MVVVAGGDGSRFIVGGDGSVMMVVVGGWGKDESRDEDVSGLVGMSQLRLVCLLDISPSHALSCLFGQGVWWARTWVVVGGLLDH